jgi:hypothetical protein
VPGGHNVGLVQGKRESCPGQVSVIFCEPEQRSRELFRQGGYRRRDFGSTLLLQKDGIPFFNAVDGGSHQSGTVPGDAYLVVAADGVHSMVRRSVWGQGYGAKLTPYLAVRGVLPLRHGT